MGFSCKGKTPDSETNLVSIRFRLCWDDHRLKNMLHIIFLRVCIHVCFQVSVKSHMSRNRSGRHQSGRLHYVMTVW